MTREQAAFYIEYAVSGESGRHTVVGRCGSVPVRVGDVFTRSFLEAIPMPVAEKLGAARGTMDEKPVELRVVEIRAYGRSIDEVGEGMTGSLALVGNGAVQAAPGRVLGGVVSRAAAANPDTASSFAAGKKIVPSVPSARMG